MINSLGDDGTAHALRRLEFSRSNDGSGQHDEAWLQRLIQNFPQVLPIGEIEPAFEALLPVCTELATPVGFVDNVFLTPTGNLVLAECKLWRNPEARREVVAQAIDYAESISQWSYEELESAALKAGLSSASLFELVTDASSLDEAGFIDAVSRNLRLGRVHLMIVGDGIREGVESLTRSIQKHAGFHFTMSLVEMPVYELPSQGFVVVPRILARTKNIERGIVKLSDDRLQVGASSSPDSGAGQKSSSISQEHMIETLRENAPQTVTALDQFIEKASELGVFMEPAVKSLVIRWHGPDDNDFALASIRPDGKLITYNVGWRADYIGRVDLAHDYLRRIADLVGGSVRETSKAARWFVVREGTTEPEAIELLNHEDEWLSAIEEYTSKLAEALQQS